MYIHYRNQLHSLQPRFLILRTQCHTEAIVPDGWLSYTDSKLLEEAASING